MVCHVHRPNGPPAEAADANSARRSVCCVRSFCPRVHSFARSSCGADKRSNKVLPRSSADGGRVTAWQRTIKCSLHGATRPSVATRPSSTITTDMHMAIDTSMPDRSAADLFILLKTLSAPSCRHVPWHVHDVSVGTMQNEPVDTSYVSPARILCSDMQRNELYEER